MQKLTFRFNVVDELNNPLSCGKRTEYFYNDLNYLNKNFDSWIASRYLSEYFGHAKISISIKLWNHDYKKVYESESIFTIKSLCEQLRIEKNFDADIAATQALAKKLWYVE